MSIFLKTITLCNRIASSILSNKEADALRDSDLFNDSDKDYILENLTNDKLIKNRAELLRDINKKQGWAKIERRIDLPVRRHDLWKYAAAATIVLFIATTTYLSQEKLIEKAPQNKPLVVKTNINPGTDKAILVLANGEKVTLGKGSQYNSKNVHSNGKEIIYNNDPSDKTTIAYNYLTIPTGGQFFVKLADGTKVWLNSESKLKFPVSFIDGQPRQVELVYGEAYFDVSHSTAHNGSHFKVLTNSQNVEVLGTGFNIKAYQNDSYVYTTLVEGKISLSNAYITKNLKPGDQSILNLKNNNIELSDVDVFNEVSWKEGVFSFQEMKLKDIMKVLERWYDVKTIFKNQATENITINGILDKNQKIEKILNIISNTNNIPYEINQKTIIFK